jgi:hypothetical protein
MGIVYTLYVVMYQPVLAALERICQALHPFFHRTASCVYTVTYEIALGRGRTNNSSLTFPMRCGLPTRVSLVPGSKLDRMHATSEVSAGRDALVMERIVVGCCRQSRGMVGSRELKGRASTLVESRTAIARPVTESGPGCLVAGRIDDLAY